MDSAFNLGRTVFCHIGNINVLANIIEAYASTKVYFYFCDMACGEYGVCKSMPKFPSATQHRPAHPVATRFYIYRHVLPSISKRPKRAIAMKGIYVFLGKGCSRSICCVSKSRIPHR